LCSWCSQLNYSTVPLLLLCVTSLTHFHHVTRCRQKHTFITQSKIHNLKKLLFYAKILQENASKSATIIKVNRLLAVRKVSWNGHEWNVLNMLFEQPFISIGSLRVQRAYSNKIYSDTNLFFQTMMVCKVSTQE